MRRLSAFMATVLVVLMTSASGSVAFSDGCGNFNAPSADGDYIQRNTEVQLGEGEIVTFTATSTGSGSDPFGIALSVGPAGTPPQDLPLVDSDGFPGTVSYTVPSDGGYAVFWTTQSQDGPFAATWDVSCELPNSDADGDGVVDSDDVCGDTVLTEPPPDRWKKNHYWTDATGQFLDPYGRDSGYTITDTRGCSAAQIIEAADLGRGHTWFGITKSALTDWVDSIS